MRIRTSTVVAMAATCVAAQARWSMWPPGWPWNWSSYLRFDSPSGPLHQNGTSEASVLPQARYTLPALKQGKVYDKLYVSEGAQTWFDGETLYTRNRLVYIMSVPGYFDIWDFTGGGGGGG